MTQNAYEWTGTRNDPENATYFVSATMLRSNKKKKSGTVSTNIWFIIQILLMSKLKCCLLLAFLHKVSYTFTVDLTLDFTRISQYYTEFRDMLVCYQCQMEKDCIYWPWFSTMVIYFTDKKYTCIEPYIARTFFFL